HGSYLLARRRYDEALAEFRAAVALDHDSPLPPLGMGLVCFERRQVSDRQTALDHFRQAERAAPDHPPVLVNVAVCLEALEGPAAARAYWEKALPRVTDPATREQIRRHLDRK